MNTFDGFNLTGANIARYIPILGNAASIISAYRKRAEAVEIGRVPLFLLDGELPAKTLIRAVAQLNSTKYITIYRPFDTKIKKKFEDLYQRVRSAGFLKKNGTAADWVLENKHRFEANTNGLGAEFLRPIQIYIDYEKAQEDYISAAGIFPIDATTGKTITSDLNEYLYERAKSMFPLGVESILETNVKQSSIPKTQFFMDGLKDVQAPKGVRKDSKVGWQMSLFDLGGASVDDSIFELRGYLRRRIEKEGAVTLPEILCHCAEIGLYKGNVTLYAIGATLRAFDNENTVFYDGVGYWRFADVKDISSWILRVYDVMQPRLIKGKLKTLQRKESQSAIFYDNTSLKDRLRGVFELKPTSDKPEHDTLGMVIVQMGQWVIENLRYPIAFTDLNLHRIYRENNLYGDKMQAYDNYFTPERCGQIKEQLPYADSIARQAIEAEVGFDPNTTTHPLSNLGKGHYAPILWSAEEYIEEIRKEQPPWMKERISVVSASRQSKTLA